jgi:hypothetical protein
MTMVDQVEVLQQLEKNGPKTEPTRQQVARVRAAIDSLDDDVDIAKLLPLGFRVIFGWVDFVPGTTDRAAGYCTNKRTTRVRWGMSDAPNPTYESSLATIVHEGLGHCRLLQVPLTRDQQRECLQLLTGPSLPSFMEPGEVWKKVVGEGDYWLRPYENVIDSMVPALSDVISSWHDKYKRRIPPGQYQKLKALWLDVQSAPADMGLVLPTAVEPNDPIDPEDVVPRVIPEPTLTDLQAQLDALRLKTDQDLDDTRAVQAAAQRIIERHSA